jgi:hypothetical protein
MKPSSGSIMIIQLRVFELPSMDPHLVLHFHISKAMPKLKYNNYNNKLIKILRVYKDFYIEILAVILPEGK